MIKPKDSSPASSTGPIRHSSRLRSWGEIRSSTTTWIPMSWHSKAKLPPHPPPNTETLSTSITSCECDLVVTDRSKVLHHRLHLDGHCLDLNRCQENPRTPSSFPLIAMYGNIWPRPLKQAPRIGDPNRRMRI